MLDLLSRYPSSRVLNRQQVTGLTGTIAAGLASGACICAARYPTTGLGKTFLHRLHPAGLASGACICAARYPTTGLGKTFLHRLHLHYVCLGAFTTPITASRNLVLKRGAGADPAGGNALDIADADSVAAVAGSQLLTGRIASTAALTVAGITFETAPRARLLLSHKGQAGDDYDEIWDLSHDPLILAPGELFGICAGQLFDAAGTWQLSVKGEAIELG